MLSMLFLVAGRLRHVNIELFFFKADKKMSKSWAAPMDSSVFKVVCLIGGGVDFLVVDISRCLKPL